MAGTLDGHGQLTLMAGTSAGHSAGDDLGSLGKVSPQAGDILIIDGLDLIYAEGANLSAGLSVAGSLGSFIALHGNEPPLPKNETEKIKRI